MNNKIGMNLSKDIIRMPSMIPPATPMINLRLIFCMPYLAYSPEKDCVVERLTPADARTMRWKGMTTYPIPQHN